MLLRFDASKRKGHVVCDMEASSGVMMGGLGSRCWVGIKMRHCRQTDRRVFKIVNSGPKVALQVAVIVKHAIK